jgi:hypothetical protein
MDASRIHSVIAAGLSDPALLAHWRQTPELLRRVGVDPAQLDLDALWKFAGLAEKIRCNPCRGDVPLTFRMLNKTGLEIEVFAGSAGRATELRRAGRNGAREKMRALDQKADIAQRFSSSECASKVLPGCGRRHNGRRMPSLLAITDSGSGRVVCEAPACSA